MGKSVKNRKKNKAGGGDGGGGDIKVFLEQGNVKFEAEDYAGARVLYEKALNLTPENLPEHRAGFHSNIAACLMQMKPVDYETVITHCSLALELKPNFGETLLMRALAFKAISDNRAMEDVQSFLVAEPNHTNHADALEAGAIVPSKKSEDFLKPLTRPCQSVEHQQRRIIQYRPLKLVYEHDIRLAQMPVDCSFKVLRGVVGETFPMLRALLIKYKDSDGELVTITCSTQLKLAESSVDDPPATLKLHIVQVSPEQEPPLLEEEEEVVEYERECKKVEMDDWLFDFHELGLKLCSEAMEETMTTEEAQSLLDKAVFKFQEVIAFAYFNCGNVHMCAERKRLMPIDESAADHKEKLQDAYDWVKEKYTIAKENYEKALLFKQSFHEGFLALAQQEFEMAKFDWLFILAKKDELSKWDSTKTIGLFDSAVKKMKLATAMLEKQRASELKDPSSNKIDGLLKRKKKPGSGAQGDDSGIGETTPEQADVRRSKIHLLWGNILFEKSQIEYKLTSSGWQQNLDDAVEQFKLAGASEADISTFLKNHYSVDVNEKKFEDVPQ